MVENSDTPPSVHDFVAKIVALIAQVQENVNKLLALEDENATLRRENHNLSERLSDVENTPYSELWFQVLTTHIQLLMTPELGKSSSQPLGGSPTIHNISPAITSKAPPPITSEAPLLITSSAVDTALLYAMSAKLNALNASLHRIYIQPSYLLLGL